MEVLRALAEELGELGRIGSERIPSRIIAGGMQAVLSRRLGRVPAAARPLLCAAAVLGRELDLLVLRALPAELSERLEGDLAECAAVAVLEVHEDRWRFAHDKLREALLANLSAAELVRWHLHIGSAIEQAHAASIPTYAAALAHHFDQAGEPIRAFAYRVQAGEQSLNSGAVQEAIVQLERALPLLDAAGAALMMRVHAMGLLCRAYLGAGRPSATVDLLDRMLASVGFAALQAPSELFAELARLAAAHLSFRMQLRKKWESESAAVLASLGEISDTIEEVGPAIALARTPEQAVRYFLIWISIADRLGEPMRAAPPYNALAFIFTLTPFRRLSKRYFQLSREFAAQAPSLPRGVQVRLRGSEAWAHGNHGEWEEASNLLSNHSDALEAGSDWNPTFFALLSSARIAVCRGDAALMLSVHQRLERLARRADNPQYFFWALILLGARALHVGETALAKLPLDEARVYEAQASDHTASALWRSQSALCALRSGEPAQARQLADVAMEELKKVSPTASMEPVTSSGLIETYLSLWSEARGTQLQSELAQRLHQALGMLRMSGVIMPICRPRGLFWHGRYAALRGHRRLAEKLAQAALAAARRYDMPCDQGLAHELLAELAESRGDRARAHAEKVQASTIFQQLGARWNLSGARPGPGAPEKLL